LSFTAKKEITNAIMKDLTKGFPIVVTTKKVPTRETANQIIKVNTGFILLYK